MLVLRGEFRIQYRTRIQIINTEQKDGEGLVGGASAAAAAQIGKRGEKWDFSMCCIKKGKIHPDICYTWSNKGAERPGAFVFVSIS